MDALCQMKDTHSIPTIVGHLNTANEVVIPYMMQGLIELEAESELQSLTKHENAYVRTLAESALKTLKN
jgi:hypothetical protein